MRVVVIAQDDAGTKCLMPLVGKGHQVLGICGTEHSAAFAKRCVDLGFDCLASQDSEAVKMMVSHFRAELLLCVPGGACLPKWLAELALPSGVCKYLIRFGQESCGAPWPEFLPIWQQSPASHASLLTMCGDEFSASVAQEEVAVMPGETALSLRAKHEEAAARLVQKLLQDPPSTRPEKRAKSEELSDVPMTIGLDWEDEQVERYLRAWTFPPHNAASAVDPSTGDAYIIENMSQFGVFKSTVCSDGATKDSSTSRVFAADTHWYSNVGGSIVKMGDKNLHMPKKSVDAHVKIIPGAAVPGGREKLRLNEPLIGPNADKYCSNALASSWIGVEGPFVKRFEAHLADICGCLSACAVQSGTAALYGAVKALGVSKPEHHVLVPSFTCAAAADAVVHAGGTPISVDCELETYGMCAAATLATLEANKTAVGVIIAHCYGVPVRDIYKIQALCQERGLWLCEDSCESYGALIHSSKADSGASPVRVGSVGTLNVVSVRSEKMIGVGEGGVIVGNDTTLVAKAKWWCSRSPCLGAGMWRVYKHDAVGQNFRMSEMLAAVGCAAAEMFPSVKSRKQSIHKWYEKYMQREELADVQLQAVSPGDTSVWWVNSSLMPEGVSGEAVGMQIMKDYPDIEIRPGFYPLDQMEIFKHPSVLPCPNTDTLFRRLVCLPSSVNLQEAQVERVCSALADALGKIRAQGGQ
jgi:dTDP-4-amino-4,6-dideoxygalactose transaminase